MRAICDESDIRTLLRLKLGGSFVCYTGSDRLFTAHAEFSKHLTPRDPCMCVMLHDRSQRVQGRLVIREWKPILWFTKGRRSGRTLVPTVVHSKYDKDGHPWSQGDTDLINADPTLIVGVRQWIYHLTEPGDLILDPFAGSAIWGRIAVRMIPLILGPPVDEHGSRAMAG
jgi:hypothetical protein